MKIRILLLTMLPVICFAQVNPNGEKPAGELLSKEISPNEMKRNASFNVEEIKVRWKKAALENCAGVPCAPSFTCGTSTISDIDGNIYETVSIGTQCWTKTNLKVTKYNNGDEIPDSTNSTWGTATIGARTGYDVSVVSLNDYVGTFGYLYNWYAATDSRKLCPDGWHVPTDEEWTILIQALDPSQVVNSGNVSTFSGIQSTTAGTVLKSAVTNSIWGIGLGYNPNSPPSPGTNTSGFTALPGGYRTNFNFSGGGIGISDLIRLVPHFWSATEIVGTPVAWFRNLTHLSGNVNRSYYRKDRNGLSVRCLKD